MTNTIGMSAIEKPEPTIKDLVNTPVKKAALILFVLSNITMVGSPAIGGTIGSMLDMTAGEIASLVFAVFVVSEVFIWTTILVMGKAAAGLVKSKIVKIFKKKPTGNN
ncbi:MULTISPECIES: hypothetical protein [Vibrio]|uniref:hypothetical protein n=1 Tax=Vibrio TaxID=662 RepID=UPI003D10C357